VIVGLLALLACQLAGEFVVRLLGVPLPGPVAGLAILLVALTLWQPAAGSRTVRAAEVLLRHLQLFFVPAGVGVVQYLSLIAASAVPLVAGLLLSWFAALATTAVVAGLLVGLTARRRTVSR
jgi:putative effector of murein hydrolase LrgA (UPF0299 family)